MNLKKGQSHRNERSKVQSSESRRKFLKQSIAFAALTATYSVISLTDLACSTSSSPSPGGVNNSYFGPYYFEGEHEYFEGGPIFYY